MAENYTDMRIILAGGVVLLFQLSILKTPDICILFLMLLMFFSSLRDSLLAALFLGFLLDLFSSVFGIHLIAYPALVLLASALSRRYLTDRSLTTFCVLSCGSFLIFRIFQEMSSALISYIIPSIIAAPLDSSMGALLIRGLLFQLVLSSAAYAVFSRMRKSLL